MAELKKIFAANLKEKRKVSGLTQAKLAEKADVSTHHIAMIELGRNFPACELIERIASVLEIDAYELFVEKKRSKNKELEQLRADIREDIKQLLEEYKIDK